MTEEHVYGYERDQANTNLLLNSRSCTEIAYPERRYLGFTVRRRSQVPFPSAVLIFNLTTRTQVHPLSHQYVVTHRPTVYTALLVHHCTII